MTGAGLQTFVLFEEISLRRFGRELIQDYQSLWGIVQYNAKVNMNSAACNTGENSIFGVQYNPIQSV